MGTTKSMPDGHMKAMQPERKHEGRVRATKLQARPRVSESERFQPEIAEPAGKRRQRSNRALRTREEQRSLEQRLRTIMDSMLEGCQIIGYDWRYLYVNDSVVAQGKQTKQGLLAHTMMEMYPGIENTVLFATLRRCMEQRTTERLENEFTFPNGSKGWFELSIQPVSEGIFILSIDITERRQAEQALKSREEFLRQIIDTSPSLIFAKDWDGRFTLANRAVAEIYGTEPAYLIGKTDADFNLNKAEVDHYVRDDREVMTTLQSKFIGEEAVTNPQKHETRWFQTIKVPLVSQDGRAPQILGVSTDITERKQAELRVETQLRRLEALRVIDAAIAGALDLRLVLNVVLEQTTAQLGVDAASMLLLNPYAQTLTYASGRGFRTQAIEQSRVRLGEGLAGKSILERRVVHVHDPIHSPEFTRATLLEDEGFAEYYAAPLITKGKIVGSLEVFHRTPYEVDEEWRTFLETLAQQAAIGVDSAQLFENLQRSNVDLSLAYDATIEGWSRALDLRDKETEGHTLRVTEMTMKLARASGMSEKELVHVRRGALLHDIGKMGVPDSILLKPDKLTDEEWEIMRQHPQFAFDMLAPIAYLRPALDIPYCHHEKWDGTGYPRGLKGEHIPISARLFAIVDVWDALRSDRPYRVAWTEDKVLEHLRSQAGTHFDPKTVGLFFQVISERA